MPGRSGDRHEPHCCTYCTGVTVSKVVRRCTHQTMPSVAREAAQNLMLNLLACHGVVCNVTTVRATEVTQTKFMLLPATFLIAAGWVAAPAQGAGCLKGAAVGGVAGHYAGHHGVLGAGAGCVIGHHEATKHAREKAPQQQQGSTSDTQVSPNSGR
jgi:hypothetical protein